MSPADGTPSDLLVHPELVSCFGPPSQPSSTVRIATWNIHALASTTLLDAQAVLSSVDADVVALQEVDMKTRRSGGLDQTRALAAGSAYKTTFAGTIALEGGDYGLAVLSRWPFAAVVRHRLGRQGGAEQRIVLEAVVCVDGSPLTLMNMHADYVSGVRERNARELLTMSLQQSRVVSVGDFNDNPEGQGPSAFISAGFRDYFRDANESTSDFGRIDYIFLGAAFTAVPNSAKVWPTSASDHMPLSIDVLSSPAP